MGMPGPLSRSCSLYRTTCAPCPPAPNPLRWKILDKAIFSEACALKVQYPDATNFEGVKIMVFLGEFDPARTHLDPHFADDELSPLARFKPTVLGWVLAVKLALEASETLKEFYQCKK